MTACVDQTRSISFGNAVERLSDGLDLFRVERAFAKPSISKYTFVNE
jgi:hypothetical protein